LGTAGCYPSFVELSSARTLVYPRPVKFVDSCQVDVIAGRGGNGVVAFRREKFVPFGGPAGGDGGRGGDIVFVADEGLSTLLDLTYGRAIRADHGEHGQGKDCYGRAGKDLIVRVPLGTQIFDRESGELLFDIEERGTRVVAAHGGKGGRGNIHFATPFDRAPRRAEPGEPGEERKLRLELKVMADVGLLGFPNVGKSTFIRAVSRAQPKVADYPFTTLTPHLGVVRVGDEATFVLADIPGLIPGAAEGHGLGHRFLKHVERCRALLHLVTLDPAEGRSPLGDYEALLVELEKFDPSLSMRPQVVAMTKADLPEVRDAYEKLRKEFAKKKRVELRLVSAATGEGVRELAIELYKKVTGKGRVEDWEIIDEPVAPPPSSAQDSSRDVITSLPRLPKAPKSATAVAARPKGPTTQAKKLTTKAAAPKKTARGKAAAEKPAEAPKRAATAAKAPKKAATAAKAPKKAAKAPKKAAKAPKKAAKAPKKLAPKKVGAKKTAKAPKRRRA